MLVSQVPPGREDLLVSQGQSLGQPQFQAAHRDQSRHPSQFGGLDLATYLETDQLTRKSQAALVIWFVKLLLATYLTEIHPSAQQDMETVLSVGCSRAHNHLVVLAEDELPTATSARLSATI